MQDREIKHFFRNENNMLNKGHLDREQNGNRSGVKYNIRIDKVLPPIEVISEYESLYPGTLEKALSIAQKEQEHRHKITHMNLKSNFRARVFGQVLNACSTAFICIVVIKFALMGLTQKAIAIAAMYMASVTLVSIFGIYCDKIFKSKGLRNNSKHKGKPDYYKK